MDGMVGQHRNEQVRADTGVRAMPDWAQAELRLQLPEGVFKVSQSPVRAENLFCIPIGVAGSDHTHYIAVGNWVAPVPLHRSGRAR